jgi:hypothetical protein
MFRNLKVLALLLIGIAIGYSQELPPLEIGSRDADGMIITAVGVAPVSVLVQQPTATAAAPPNSYLCQKCGKYHANTATGGGTSALAAANALRARRGLRPFIHDPNLQANVDRSVAIQAGARGGRGVMGHMGQGMRGARAEGVGMSGSARAFNTCSLYENWRFAAAASRQSANGNWFHALQVR